MSSWCGTRFSWIQRWKMGGNASSTTVAGSTAKSFTLSCWACISWLPVAGSGSRLLRRFLRGGRLLARLQLLHLAVAGVRRLDEQLRLLDLLVRLLAARLLGRRLVRAEQEGGELGPG